MKQNLFYAAAFALALLGCSQNDVTEPSDKGGAKTGTAFTGKSSPQMGENPVSRTSIDYDRTARTMTYYWEPGDKIWLNDGNNAETEASSRVANSSFFFTTGTYHAQHYDVYYPGKNATAYNAVTIQTTQTQAAPNSSTHFGDAGDCGVATADRQSDGGYTFALAHKAAYLCFLPRTSNVTETGWVMTAIKVTANNNIAGNYTLTTTGLTGTGSSNEITLNTGNFDISNAATSLATNGAYMVIAPGVHTLTVEYTVKNTNTGNTGTIVKHLDSKDYKANTLYPLTAHLFSEYSNTKYYLWDAIEDMWHNKTPANYSEGLYTAADVPASNLPGYASYWNPGPPLQYTGPDANRIYNYNAPIVTGFTMSHGYGNHFYYATRSAKDCPNVWELAWYYDKGDIRWDGEAAFLFRGKIYHGGVWIKKQSEIAAENSTTVAALKNTYPGVHHGNSDDLIHPDGGAMGDGHLKTIGQGAPSAAALKKYFFLPALGNYGGAGGGGLSSDPMYKLYHLGTEGFYTCSSNYATINNIDYCWAFKFNSSEIQIFSLFSIRFGAPLWKAQ